MRSVVTLRLAAPRSLVRGEDGSVGSGDQSARVLHLLEQPAAVVRVVLQALRAELVDRPPRRREDQRREQQHHDPEEVADLRVHETTPPVSSCRWRAESETIRSRASSTKLAMIELPPYEMNGSVTPVSGITFVTPPTITNTCSASTDVRPAASSFPNPSPEIIAVLKPRRMKSRYDSSSAQAPNRPSS